MRFAAFVMMAALTACAIGCGKKPSTSQTDAGPDPARGPDRPKADVPAGDDAKAIQGTWQLVSYQNPDPKKYKAADLDELKAASFKIEGKLLRLQIERDKATYLIRLNPGKSPKEFDLVEADESGKPRMLHFPTPKGTTPRPPTEKPSLKGIYRLDGDTAMVAVSSDKESRPREFKAAVIDAQKDHAVFVGEFKRAK